MEKVDVAIAGAGIAGCLAARDLARQGHSVVLVERQARADLGHDWWDAVREAVFTEVDMPAPKPPELMAHKELTTVYSPLKTTSTVVESPPGKIHIDRKLFAQRQVEYALEAGARFMDSTAVERPIIEDEKVAGMTVSNAKGEKIEIRAKLTIDATGMAAVIRRAAPRSEGFPRRMRREDSFATFREIRNRTSDSEESEVVFGVDNGVHWINRSQDGLIDFFAGALNYPGRPSPREAVRKMVRATSDAGPNIMRAGYGAPIPVRRCFDHFYSPGMLLCGDSACQCNPIDGSGIASSLTAASLAAKTIHAALENNDFSIDAFWPYVSQYKRTQGAAFAPYEVLQKFMISFPKADMDLLFTRGVISPASFWGASGVKKKESAISRIMKLLKLIDRPALIKGLLQTKKTSEEITAHFEDFPEKYDHSSFMAWKRRTDEIIASLPPKMDE